MRSYTVEIAKIQFFTIWGIALALFVGGCSSQLSVPVGSSNVDSPTVLTGSIPSNADVAYSDIDEGDRKLIARELDTLSSEYSDGESLAEMTLPWINSVSGNSGTLSNIDTETLQSTGCLTFETTANTIAGIKLYEGTACLDITKNFAVTSLTVAGA